jgi:hypothetical protein
VKPPVIVDTPTAPDPVYLPSLAKVLCQPTLQLAVITAHLLMVQLITHSLLLASLPLPAKQPVILVIIFLVDLACFLAVTAPLKPPKLAMPQQALAIAPVAPAIVVIELQMVNVYLSIAVMDG